MDFAVLVSNLFSYPLISSYYFHMMKESLFETNFSDTASYEKCPLMPVEKLGDLKTNLQKCCQL